MRESVAAQSGKNLTLSLLSTAEPGGSDQPWAE
jgi:hypothetical protein